MRSVRQLLGAKQLLVALLEAKLLARQLSEAGQLLGTVWKWEEGQKELRLGPEQLVIVAKCHM